MKVEIEAPQVNVQLVAELVNYSVDIQKVQVGPTSPFTTINLQVFADNSLQELISEYSLDGEVFQTMTLLSSDNPRPVNGTQTGTEIVLSWDHLSDLSDIPGGFFNRDVTLRFGISEYLHTYSVSEVLHINRSLVVKTEHTPAGYNASGRPVTGLPRDVKG
jgi:hypothetical protein